MGGVRWWLVARRSGRTTEYWVGELTIHGFPVTTPWPSNARRFETPTEAYEAASHVQLMADSDQWRVTAWEAI